MAGAGKIDKPAKGGKTRGKRRKPEWTSGLKQLYDSVVDEPIPTAFEDLLARLDDQRP